MEMSHPVTSILINCDRQGEWKALPTNTFDEFKASARGFQLNINEERLSDSGSSMNVCRIHSS